MIRIESEDARTAVFTCRVGSRLIASGSDPFPVARLIHLMTVAWKAQQERGNRRMIRLMAWVALSWGRPVARALLFPICLYYLCPVNSGAADTPHVLSAGAGSLARLEGTVPSLLLVCVDHSRPRVFPPRTLRSVRHHHQGGGYPRPGLGGWARMSAARLASRQLRGGPGGGIGPRGDRHQSPDGRGECTVDSGVLSRDQSCSGRQRASSRGTRHDAARARVPGRRRYRRRSWGTD